MVDVYPLTAPTIARKEAARMAREANEKRKTRQATATRVQGTAEAGVDPLPDKPFRQPDIVVSVDVTPLRGRRSGARPSAAVPAAAPAAAPASVPVADSTPAVATRAAAMEQILAAVAARKAFTFAQYNPKSGKSHECCEV
jgi:hypothetical protein